MLQVSSQHEAGEEQGWALCCRDDGGTPASSLLAGCFLEKNIVGVSLELYPVYGSFFWGSQSELLIRTAPPLEPSLVMMVRTPPLTSCR